MRMGRSHLINRCKFHERIKGFFEKYCSKSIFRKLFHVQIDFNSTSRSISISGPDRLQFHVQININFTSRSTSISRPDRGPGDNSETSIARPDRLQFYVQIDLNFTCRSTSILRPDRPQFYVRFTCKLYVRASIPKLHNYKKIKYQLGSAHAASP